MRRAVVVFCIMFCCAGAAFAEGVGFDFIIGAWVVEKHISSITSSRAGPMVGLDFQVAGKMVAYEAAASYRRYNGLEADASVLGLDNRLPVYFTGAPLRIYAAPNLGLWQFKYGLGLPPVAEAGDSDFALSLGGGLGLRVVAGRKGGYFDLGYIYQGTLVTGPEGIFASRRVLRAKGNLGISPRAGFALEAGLVEEGWSIATGGTGGHEYFTTFYDGSGAAASREGKAIGIKTAEDC
jgi:hypothetical protein